MLIFSKAIGTNDRPCDAWRGLRSQLEEMERDERAGWNGEDDMIRHIRNSSRSWSPRFMTGWLLAAILVSSPCVCVGQIPIFRRQAVPETEEEQGNANGLNSERRVNQQLEQLSLAGKAGDSSTVQEIVDSLRSADPMLIVPDPRGTFIPLHRDLVQRLLTIDSATLKALEASSGQLEEQFQASLSQGPNAMLQVLHQSAGTSTGWKAHLLLAAIHIDRGNTLAAQYWLRPLLTPAVPEDIRLAAERMSEKILTVSETPESSNGAALTQPRESGQGSEIPATDEDTSQDSHRRDDDEPSNPSDAESAESDSTKERTESSDSVDQNDGGGVSKAKADIGGGTEPSDDFSVAKAAPELFVHWMQRIPLGDAERRVSQEIVQRAHAEKLIPWTAWEPLIDESTVIVRTPYLIKAFDRTTGRHLWTKVIQRRPARTEEAALPIGLAFPQNQDDAVNRVLNSPDFVTVHRNEIVGRLAADRERVYAVCQVVDGTNFRSAEEMRMRFMIDQNTPVSAGLWELIALDKSTGRRVWTAGGSPVEEQFRNELSGAWFAGPPFVHGADLLTVTERAGRSELVSLEARTGQRRWSVPLISPENEIGRDLQRQLQTSQIQVSRGVVFVTTAGWLFAVDELTHSILWTRKLPSETPAENRPEVRFARGVQVVRKPLPFAKIWRSETPIVSGNSLLLSSSECSQLLVVEMLTGRLIRRDSAGQSNLILYADDATLIVTSNRQIQAKKIPSLEKLWSKSIDKSVAVPVGRAARYHNQLLIPMSDGTIAVRDFGTGDLLKSLTGFRPPRSAGGLFGSMPNPFAWIGTADGGDSTETTSDSKTAALSPSLLSYSPDFVAMLSLKPQELQPDQDPFQKASFLVETGQYEAALEAIKSVPIHALNAEPIRRLEFRIAIGKLTNPQRSSQEQTSQVFERLQETARTPEERALAQLLKLKSLMDQDSPELFTTLLGILAMDESVLNVLVVPLNRLEESVRNSSVAPMDRNNLETGPGSLRMPLRSLVMSHLRQLLNDADAASLKSRLESLQKLSDEDLLQIHHGALLNEYFARVEQQLATGEFRESTAHFMLAAFSLCDEKTVDRKAVLATASRLLKRLLETAENDVIREPSQAVMVKRLMQVLHDELLRSRNLGDAMRPDDVAMAVTDRWKQFPDSEYTLIPVQTAGTQSYRQVNVRPVASAQSHDAFLSAFDWSVRRDPGALLARSVLTPTASPWNLKLTAQENAVVYSDEEIQRIGSVIVLQNSAGVSAFSAIDHRWLWTRPVAGQSGRRRLMLSRMTFPNLRLSMHYDLGNPIGAFSYRWVCLQAGSRIEVIDSLNGRSLWTMNHDNDITLRILGCEGLLGLQSGAGLSRGSLELFNPLDGSVLTADVDRESIADRFLTSTAETLVMADSGFGRRRQKNIQWIRPLTREIVHSFEIEDMESCTFLDASTLAIVSGDETFDVINLQNGESRNVSFASKNEKLPDIDPSSIRIFSDSINYYVTELDDDGAFRLIGLSMTENLEPIGKQLRAASRVTGQIAWDAEFQKLSFAAFHADEVPFLLFLNDESSDGNANRMLVPGLGGTTQKWSIRGLTRLDGRPKLSYTAQIRSVNSYLQLKQLNDGVLDLDAFGSRVRFRPVQTTVP